jgi:hypothetical protein
VLVVGASLAEGITFWPVSEVIRQAAEITGGLPGEDRIGLPEPERTAVVERIVALGLGGCGVIKDLLGDRKFLEASDDRDLVVVFDGVTGRSRCFGLIEYLEGGARGSRSSLYAKRGPSFWRCGQDGQYGSPGCDCDA